MTNTTLPDEVLQRDAMGRVRTALDARREALLEEFEGSGVSAKEFAALVGVTCQTFASWVQGAGARRSASIRPWRGRRRHRCAGGRRW